MWTQTTNNLKSKIIDSSWAHRPSIKGTKPLFIWIKVITFISEIILKESIFLESNLKCRICRVTISWIPGTYVPHSSNNYTEDVDDWIFHSLSHCLSPFSVYCFSASWLFVPWWWCGWGVMFTFCPRKNPPRSRLMALGGRFWNGPEQQERSIRSCSWDSRRPCARATAIGCFAAAREIGWRAGPKKKTLFFAWAHSICRPLRSRLSIKPGKKI